MEEKTISIAEASQLLGLNEHDILLSIANKELCASKVTVNQSHNWAIKLKDLKSWLVCA